MDCPNDPKLFSDDDSPMIAILTALNKFRIFYGLFHRYLSLALCIFGMLANFIHICVLTRPRMILSPVHIVLICIAVADIGTMSSYTLYLLRYEFNKVEDNGYPYVWIMFLMIHVVVSIALHAISLYLVVFVAFIRVRSMEVRSSQWLRTRLSWIISVLIAIFTFVLCIPTLLAHEIQPKDHSNTTTTSTQNAAVSEKYSIGFSKMFMKNNCTLLKINLWLTGIAFKAIPCFLLSWLTVLLLIKLKQNKKKRERLLGTRFEKSKDGGIRDRTTYMLLLMVIVFLATELPQGVIAILNAIYTSQFHLFIYLTLADLLDLLSLINCYFAFTIYFCTCSKYRHTLFSMIKLVCRKSCCQLTVFQAISTWRSDQQINNRLLQKANPMNNPSVRAHNNSLKLVEYNNDEFV